MIPTIDLLAFEPEAMDRACSDVGFFQVVGHGLPDDVRDHMLDAAAAFFDAPTPLKRTCLPPSPEVNRGWAPLGSESLAYSLGVDAVPDLFEAFNMGAEVAEANIWPDGMPEMVPAMTAYFDTVAAIARRVASLAARTLDLAPDFFATRTTTAPDTLRVNWYRASTSPQLGQQRMGAHTDYGILTVLYADAVPGLEIVAPDGHWTGVQPEPGSLLVNLGDLLAQWTNDRWRSTLHRVVPGTGLRRSAAYFHEANPETVVEPLPSCVDGAHPARYAPVLAGEHLRAKLLGPRALRPSVASQTVGDRRT